MIQLPDCLEQHHQSPLFQLLMCKSKMQLFLTLYSPSQKPISVLTDCNSCVTPRVRCCHVGHFPLLKGSNDLSLPQCISKIDRYTHEDEDISAALRFKWQTSLRIYCSWYPTLMLCCTLTVQQWLCLETGLMHCDVTLRLPNTLQCTLWSLHIYIWIVQRLIFSLAFIRRFSSLFFLFIHLSPVPSFPPFPWWNSIHPSYSPLCVPFCWHLISFSVDQAGPVCTASPPCG